MRIKKHYRHFVLSLAPLVAVLALAGSMPVLAQSQTYTFDISAQELGSALRAFAYASRQQVVFEDGAVRGKRSPQLKGDFTANEALDRLLEGSGLSVKTGQSGLFIVHDGVQISLSKDRTGSGLRVVQSSTQPETQKDPGHIQDQLSKVDEPSAALKQQDVNEIVVTAQKREERLQDVPISMSVLSGADLDSSNAQGISEHLSRVAGVATLPAAIGASTIVMVRGVAPADNLVGGSGTTGFYLDSVPFGFVFNPRTPDANAYDLERVEVLRGPQGTLYGASALNGVVRVLTNDADLDEFDAKGRVSTSKTKDGTGNLRGDMAFNLPIVEGKLAARAVMGYADLGGWIDRPDSNNANDALLRSARLKLNAEPAEQITLGLSYWGERDSFGGPNQADDLSIRNALLDEPSSSDFDTFGFNAAFQLPGFAVKSMTSYLEYDADTWLDLGAPVIPGALDRLHLINTSEVFSQEFNLTSTTNGVWRWSGGAIYRDGKENQWVSLLPSVFPTPQSQDYESKSYAIFGQVSRSFWDERLELSGGVRYFHDQIQNQGHDLGQDPNGPPILGARQEFEAWTPRAVLTWHSNQNLMFYGTYSQGFRSGVPQHITSVAIYPEVPPAEPDKLTNYEIGSKGSLFDGLFTFDASIYYIDWKDAQLLTTLAFPGQTTVLVPVTFNVGSASGFGVDAAVTFHPVQNLAIGASISKNDLQSDSIVRSRGTAILLPGQRLNFSAEQTASGWIEYGFPLLGNFRGSFSASASFTSEQSIKAGNPATPDQPRVAGVSDDILIARASVGLIAPKHWQLSVYGENLNNEAGILTPSLTGNGVRVRPRTIGIQFEYGFR